MHTVLESRPGHVQVFLVTGDSAPTPIGNELPNFPESIEALRMEVSHLNGGMPPALQRTLSSVCKVLELEQRFLLTQLAKGLDKMITEASHGS